MSHTLSDSLIDLSVGATKPSPLPALQRLTAAVGLAMCPAPEPQVVLDLSCREGQMLEQVRLLSPTSTLLGIDPWQDAVAAARHRLGPDAQICQMNGEAVRAERLPGLRPGIDLAISCRALTTSSRTLTTLASVIGKLKVGGQLYLTDLVPATPVRERTTLPWLGEDLVSPAALTALADPPISAPELFGLLSDASTASGRTTAIRISTAGLGGHPSGSREAERLARDPRVRAALDGLTQAGGNRQDAVADQVLHAHLVREA